MPGKLADSVTEGGHGQPFNQGQGMPEHRPIRNPECLTHHSNTGRCPEHHPMNGFGGVALSLVHSRAGKGLRPPPNQGPKRRSTRITVQSGHGSLKPRPIRVGGGRALPRGSRSALRCLPCAPAPRAPGWAVGVALTCGGRRAVGPREGPPESPERPRDGECSGPGPGGAGTTGGNRLEAVVARLCPPHRGPEPRLRPGPWVGFAVLSSPRVGVPGAMGKAAIRCFGLSALPHPLKKGEMLNVELMMDHAKGGSLLKNPNCRRFGQLPGW